MKSILLFSVRVALVSARSTLWTIVGPLVALSSVADEPENTDAKLLQIEEVVVVGSLIKRSEVYDGRAPVQTLDTANFESSGAAQAVDILAGLTANTGSNLATQQNYLQGVSQFSLRGVGLSSTLTLINGRRAGMAPVSNDVGQSFFDINTLPVLKIERVEILRDGASATYGSQAVAGVANIVTRKAIDGFELTGGIRNAVNRAYDLGVATGLETIRGSLSFYGVWYKQNENFRRDFDWLIPRALDPDGDGNIVEGSFDSGRGSPGSFRRATVNPDGSYSPFQFEGVDSPRVPDPDCVAGGGYLGGNLCRVDFFNQRTMIAAEERTQYFLDGEHDLNENVSLFSEIGYSRNEITDRVGNMLLFSGNVERTNEIFVPANHPFNFWTDVDNDGVISYIDPSDWDPETHEAVPVAYFGRPFGAEVAGDNAGDESRIFENARILVGFSTLLPHEWEGEGHVMRALSNLSVKSERHWIAAEFARLVQEGLWNPFGTRLVASSLVTPKTVDGDGLVRSLVGRHAGNDPETGALFEAVRTESAESVQSVAEFVASGDIFNELEQPIALAIGLQHRTVDYRYTPDPLNAAGLGPQRIRDSAAAAEQSVWAGFVESLFYIRNKAEIQVAARHEKYRSAGSSTDPKIAGQLFLTDRLSARVSWGSAFQAPSVFQVSGNSSSRTLTDPFRFNNLGMGECTIDSSGSIVNRGDNFAVRTILTSSGLSPQKANFANVGFLLQETDRAGLSIDYWRLDYQEVIAQGRSFQAIVDDDCRDDGHPNDPRVRRDSSGQLSAVATEYENIGAVLSSGLDLNTYIEFRTDFGDLRFNVDATLLSQFDVSSAGGGYIDQLGSRNDSNGFAPTPELRANVGISWQQDGQAAGLTMRYIDSYENDEVATLPIISSQTTFDVFYTMDLARFLGKQLTASAGIRNLTDADPPGLPTGREGIHRYNLRPGFDGSVHDIKGRTIFLRFRYRSGS